MVRFASVDVILGSISYRTFLSYAALRPFSWLLCLSQKAPPVQRVSERQKKREQRKGGRKRDGVALLLMICKSAPEPMHCCHRMQSASTAAADTGLSLAVINSMHTHLRGSQTMPLFRPPPPSPLSSLKQHSKQEWQFTKTGQVQFLMPWETLLLISIESLKKQHASSQMLSSHSNYLVKGILGYIRD